MKNINVYLEDSIHYKLKKIKEYYKLVNLATSLARTIEVTYDKIIGDD